MFPFPGDWQRFPHSLQHNDPSVQVSFLATLVALHFTPVSESASDSFGLA